MMSRARIGNLQRHLNVLLSDRSPEVDDTELLRRFVQQRDQASFEALVQRYGPMVMRLCRRLLRHTEDAEDVFQATFLVFSQKAASIRKSVSIGSWLYGSAYRIASNVRNRTVYRSQQISPPASECVASVLPNAAEEVTWREVCLVLDEELLRLPEKYRGPILLCFVEGKSQQAAARQLGMPRKTFIRLLEHGRKLLSARLTARGLTGVVVLLAVQAGRGVAVAASLISRTVNAGVALACGQSAGGVSAAASVLAHEAMRGAGLFALRQIIAVFVVAICLAAGTIALTFRDSPRPSVTHPLPATTEALAASRLSVDRTVALPGLPAKVSVKGRAVGADGNALAGARVVLLTPRPFPWSESGDPDAVAAEAASDAEGRFELEAMVPADASADRPLKLMSHVPGHGLVTQELSLRSQMQVELRMPAEEEITFSLHDSKGKPAADALIAVVTVGVVGHDKPEGAETGEHWPAFWPAETRTNLEGKAILRGLSSKTGVRIQVREDRFARQTFAVKSVHSEHTVLPGRKLHGRVVLADKRQGVAGALLRLRSKSIGDIADTEGADFCTDAQGYFHLQLPVGTAFKVRTFPPASSNCVGNAREFTWSEIVDRDHVEIALPRGRVLAGTVVDEESGQPLPGAYIHFLTADGRFLHSQTGRFLGSQPDEAAAVRTDAAGKFRIAGLALRGHLLAQIPGSKFVAQQVDTGILGKGEPNGEHLHVLAAVPVGGNADELAIRVPLRRGETISAQVIDSDGQPVADGIALCRSQVSPVNCQNPRVLPVVDGCLTLPGCDRNQSYPVFVLDAAGQQGAVAELSARDAGLEGARPKIRLAPCGTAVLRFIDEQGQPLRNFWAGHLVFVSAPEDFSGIIRPRWKYPKELHKVHFFDRRNYPHNASLWTDDEGRLTLTALIPGATYLMYHYSDGGSMIFTPEFCVKPAEKIILPEVVVPRPDSGNLRLHQESARAFRERH